MEKKVLLKELVDTGTNIRKWITPKAMISDKGNRPAGEFWDANTIMQFIAMYVETGGYISTDIPRDSVGSQLIIDKSIKIVDLSNEITDKLNSVNVDERDENLSFDPTLLN